MKIYIVDRWKSFGVDENVVICATKELAEKEILRLEKEDEDYFKETERIMRLLYKNSSYTYSNSKEYRYKIREEELKEEESVIDPKQKLISLKEDEINCLDKVYKNLKYLQLLYTVGDLKDTDKEFQVNISLTNVSYQKNKAEKELEELNSN